jgi:hypothetical protein
MPDAGYKLRLHPILVLFENFFLARLACASPSPLQPPTSAVSSRGVIMVCEHLVPFFFHVSSFLLLVLLKKTKKKIRCCDGFPLSFGHRGC